MKRRTELLAQRDPDSLVLASPDVGTFTCALPKGSLLAPGTVAGVLNTLGGSLELVVPAGIFGRVVSNRPELLNHPVGYGTTLYQLADVEGSGAAEPTEEAVGNAGGLVFRTPHSGRFWHRPSPQDAPYVQVGDVLEEGAVVGLIEVMKTFTHLTYASGTELPSRARVVATHTQDGQEIAEGAVLLEVEPA